MQPTPDQANSAGFLTGRLLQVEAERSALTSPYSKATLAIQILEMHGIQPAPPSLKPWSKTLLQWPQTSSSVSRDNRAPLPKHTTTKPSTATTISLIRTGIRTRALKSAGAKTVAWSLHTTTTWPFQVLRPRSEKHGPCR